MERQIISQIHDIAESLDRLITVDVCAAHIVRGSIVPLYDAALRLVGKPLTLAAAEELKNVCVEDSWIIISVGFVLHPYLPHGESDGPIGGVALARALNKAFGCKILFLTEKECIKPLRATMAAASLVPLEPDIAKEVSQAMTILEFPVDVEDAKKESERIFNEYNPVAMITLEKIGRNEKGVYHTSPGGDMSASTAKVDLLFDKVREEKRLTIGIGDYGNEIGLGALSETIKEIAPTARKCNCPCGAGIGTIVEAKIPFVASIANWGAYGIIACLAAMQGDMEILHDPDTERRMIEQCCLTGCADGVTVKPSFSADGITYKGHMAINVLLREIIEAKTRITPFIRK